MTRVFFLFEASMIMWLNQNAFCLDSEGLLWSYANFSRAALKSTVCVIKSWPYARKKKVCVLDWHNFKVTSKFMIVRQPLWFVTILLQLRPFFQFLREVSLLKILIESIIKAVMHTGHEVKMRVLGPNDCFRDLVCFPDTARKEALTTFIRQLLWSWDEEKNMRSTDTPMLFQASDISKKDQSVTNFV